MLNQKYQELWSLKHYANVTPFAGMNVKLIENLALCVQHAIKDLKNEAVYNTVLTTTADQSGVFC